MIRLLQPQKKIKVILERVEAEAEVMMEREKGNIIIQEEIEIIAVEEKSRRKTPRRTLRKNLKRNQKRNPKRIQRKIRRSMKKDLVQIVHLTKLKRKSNHQVKIFFQEKLSLEKFSDYLSKLNFNSNDN